MTILNSSSVKKFIDASEFVFCLTFTLMQAWWSKLQIKQTKKINLAIVWAGVSYGPPLNKPWKTMKKPLKLLYMRCESLAELF